MDPEAILKKFVDSLSPLITKAHLDRELIKEAFYKGYAEGAKAVIGVMGKVFREAEK